MYLIILKKKYFIYFVIFKEEKNLLYNDAI